MSNFRAVEDATARRYREASQWLLRLNDATAEESEVTAWLRWCEEDPQNLQAFENVQRDWRDIVALRQDAAFALNHGQEVGLIDKPKTEVSGLVGSARYALMAAAAVMLLAVGLFAYWPRGQSIVADNVNQTTSLADGSLMTLRAQAAVRVNYNAEQRVIRLQKDGEAYFKVKHDAARPFVVRIGELAVQAVGTAFDVKHDAAAGRIFVTVEEGKVRVSGGGSPRVLSAGDRLEYAQANSTVSLVKIDLKQASGWRKGEFAYQKVPLRTVVEEVGRYSSRRISIADPQVGEIAYTGTVFTRSLEDWLTALSATYPVQVSSGVRGDIELRSASSP